MIAHMTRLVSQTNVWTLAHSPFAEAEPGVKQRDTRVSAFVPLACKAIPLCHALKLAANPMMTVPLMKNVIIKAESVYGFASHQTAPRGHDVRQIITERHVPATTHYKEMAIHLAILVRHIEIFVSQTFTEAKSYSFFSL